MRRNTYFYRVLLPHGAVRSGLLRLAVERDLSARMRLEAETDGAVIHLWRFPDWLAEAGDFAMRIFRQRMRAEDLAGFLRDLGLMMTAGVPALAALDTLVEESDSVGGKAVGHVARRMRDDLNAGVGMAEAFGRHPDAFPETVRNPVSIGDQSGTLDRMLHECAEHVIRATNIRRDIKTALIYPLFVFATIFGVAGFWIYYVVPNLARLFKQLDAKMPVLTLWVVSLADSLSANLPWVLLTVSALAIGGVFAFGRSERLQLAVYAALHRLPVVRTLLVSSGMAHMTEHLSILVRAGVDMMSSLGTLGRATGNRFYRVRLMRMAELIGRGESLASSMRRVGGFPAMAVRMIAVGEESGSLDKQLVHLAVEYRKRLDVLVKSLAEILKPAIILVAGGMFMLLIMAMLLPVYDLIRQSVNQSMGG